MKNQLFNGLWASVREMDDITQDKKTAAWVTTFPEPKAKANRKNAHLFCQKCEFSHIFTDFLLFRLSETDKIILA